MTDALRGAAVTHAKLTFVGVQEKPILTLVWIADTASLPPGSRAALDAGQADRPVMAVFARAVPQAVHDNDELPVVRAFRVGAAEMAEMVRVAGQTLHHPVAPAQALLSLTLVAADDRGATGVEHLVAFDHAWPLYRALIAGLSATNAEGRAALERQALDAGVFRR